MADALLRQACDRCHAQKLSCQRIGDETCARCARASKSCTTSPSLRNKGRHQSGAETRQTKSSRAKRQQRVGSNLSSSVCTQAPQIELPPFRVQVPNDPFVTPTWHSMQGGDGFPWPEPMSLPPTPTSQHALTGTNTSSMPGAGLWLDPVPALLDIDMSDDHHQLLFSPTKQQGETPKPDTPTTNSLAINPGQTGKEPAAPESTDRGWVSKLADLNVQLHKLTKRVAQRLRNKELDVAAGVATHDRAAQDNSGAFDDALGLFFQLLQILRDLVAVPPAQCSAESESGREEAPDHGSIYLILSCYIRVLRICTDLLAMSRQGAAAGSVGHEEMPLPSVSIAALTLEAYPTLRLKVALEFLEGALDQLRAVLDPVVQSLERNSHGDGRAPCRHGIPDPSQQGLRTQEDALYNLIKQIRRDLDKGGRRMFM